jgi:DNA polymerase-1
MKLPLFEKIRNAACQDCALHQTAQAVCLIGDGRYPADVMLVGEAPGFREDSIRKPFAGKAGRLLDSILDTVGLSRPEIFISNAVHCRPPDNRKPTAKEIETCRKYLTQELAYVKPKVIIALGNIALRGLLGKKAPNVTNARGQRFTLGDATVVGTYHPAAALRTPTFTQIIIDDFRWALSFLNGTPQPVTVKPRLAYTLVTRKNFSEVCDQVRRGGEVVAFDVESTGLDMYDRTQKLISFALCPEPGIGFCFPIHHQQSDLNVDQVTLFLRRLYREKKIVGHKILFDMQWSQQVFHEAGQALRDTKVMFHLIDENYPDKSLKHLALVYTKIGELLKQWEAKVKGDKPFHGFTPDVPLEDLLHYNCGDADATIRLYRRTLKWLREEKLIELMKFQSEVTRMLLDVELAGFQIDPDERQRLRQVYHRKIVKSGEELRRPYRADLNLSSPKQVADLLFRQLKIPIEEHWQTPKGEPSVKEAVLLEIASDRTILPRVRSWVQGLLQYREDTKIFNTYLEGLDVKADGKVHPDYHQTGTVTGRLSCSDPNLQQIPREGPVKSMFVSRWPRGGILQMDYNQVELRVLAHYSGDPGLIEAFRTGKDIHRAVAAKVFKKPETQITEQERKFTKQVNFGICYCISPVGLSSKIGTSEDEARRLMRDWFREFPRVKPWMREMENRALKYHMVWNEFGRRRRFGKVDYESREGREALRQAVNTPVQGTASDVTVLSMLEFWKWLRKEGMKSKIVANVHDAILVDSPAKEVKHVSQALKRICEHPPLRWRFGFDLKVPLVAELKAGPSWGAQQKWET